MASVFQEDEKGLHSASGVVAPLVVVAQCGAFLMGPDAHYPQVSGVIAVNFV